MRACADDVTANVIEHVGTIVTSAAALLNRIAVVLRALQLPIARGKAKVEGSDDSAAKQVVALTREHGFK
eukprot:564010-Pyramimonas_sp.AAC.1